MKAATVCTYEGSPAVTVRTGRAGNQFGLCAECATAHDASVTAQRIVDQLEIDRAAMQAAGKSTPAYEEFMDHLIAIISCTHDPAGALGIVLRLLTRERATPSNTAGSRA
ncbi:hypothetical protein LRD69_13880 [Streptomyces sp. JH14]|uniref:hypothetical protein n=1 Tax=Streptomyces sp. JH14 TaxID=2793630 RepID=UPI0023F9D245|nr:hypothetical protein [Streptomyces sp. JH14]MDF6043217.1 hypothetical protein [Streptomyces sp. JH14]